ncbi:MAG: hypothetical protein R2705_08010 [Ilumatobacteraceae bacterium]
MQRPARSTPRSTWEPSTRWSSRPGGSNWPATRCDPSPISASEIPIPWSASTRWARSILEALGRIVPHVNLEIVEPGPEPHGVTMRVHERGAGITEACGTGACAPAWAAARWGLATPKDAEILVHMDGGDASVRLHHPSEGRVTLIGPATYVATINW